MRLPVTKMLGLSVGLLVIHLLTDSVLAQSVQNNVYGVGTDDVVTLSFVENIFESVLSIIIRLIGIGAFIMLLVGGMRYLFSGGDQEAVAKSKSTISWAVGGLALVFGVWFILLFISKITDNPNLLQFDFFFIP
jgi:hypothetical protein